VHPQAEREPPPDRARVQFLEIIGDICTVVEIKLVVLAVGVFRKRLSTHQQHYAHNYYTIN